MKLISRQRSRHRNFPRITISQAEITADLNYPAAGNAEARRAARGDRRGDR